MIINWFKKNLVLILIGLSILIYTFANLQSVETKNKYSEEDFICQTSCFPQQHEYIYAGITASCWCYVNKSTLQKIGN